MAKLTLSDVSNILGNPTSAAATINANNTLIETALENTLSRNGTIPNTMTADLDLNNNDILDVNLLSTNSLTVNGLPLVPGDAVNAANFATAAQGLKADTALQPAAIGTTIQPLDSDLTAIAALVSAANQLPYATGSGTWALTPFTAFARTILDDADASTALTTLGVSAFAQTILDDADASAVRTTIGAQPLDTDLTAIAALTSAADQLAYATGAGTWAMTGLTAFGRGLIDDANSSAGRATLGLVIGTNVQAFRLSGSATFDPPSLADGAGTTTTVTVTGAVMGNFAIPAFSLSTQGITVTANVTAADTVTVRFQNETGGVIDLGSGTLSVAVFN